MLTESEERYRRITAGLTDYLYTVKIKNGKAVETIHNDACRIITGYTPEEFADDPYLWINMVVPEEREFVAGNFSKIIEGKDAEPIEHRIICKDGKIRWISDTTIPQYDPTGVLISYDGVIKDITRRKQAEDALRKSENELKEAQRLTQIGSWDWDIATDTITWSEEYYRIYDLDPAQSPPGYVEHLKAYTAESAARLDAAVKKNMETGEPYTIDLELAGTDGKRRWITARSETKRDAQGRIIGLRGTAQDITERKRADEALHQSQRKLEFHLEQTLFAVIEWDTEFRARYWNPAAERIFGYRKEEALGRSGIDLIVPGDVHSNVEEVWNQLMQEACGASNINENVTRDGRIIICEWINTPLADEEGRVIGVISIANDITERKQAEKRMLKLTTAVEQSPVVVVITDREGSIEYVNPKFIELTGYAFDEAIGKNPRILKSGNTPKEAYVKLWATITSGNVWTGTFQNKKKNGELYWESASIAPILNEKGAIESFIAVKEDITDRMRTEEEIKNLNATLEKRVMERTAELEYANSELEAFTYSVSHDLRAPLRVIDGFSSFLLKDYENKLDEEGKRLIGVIRKNTQMMDRLIIDLLSLSRVTKGEMKRSLIDMQALVSSIYNEMAVNNALQSFDFNIKAMPNAWGDATLMRQAWFNFISNAVKFTSKSDLKKIEVGGYRADNEKVYFVRDSGVGFNPEYAHKLFGVFKRLHKSEDFEGNGVGLAIVHRIILRHKGRVWAEGKENAGATFYFAIPDIEG